MASIVIVDDSAANLKIYAKLAETVGSGAKVFTFSEPWKALAHLTEGTTDLVVTDYKMPKMTGAEMISANPQAAERRGCAGDCSHRL